MTTFDFILALLVSGLVLAVGFGFEDRLAQIVLIRSGFLSSSSRVTVRWSWREGLVLHVEHFSLGQPVRAFLSRIISTYIPLELHSFEAHLLEAPVWRLLILAPSLRMTGVLCLWRRTYERDWDDRRYYARQVWLRRWAAEFAVASLRGKRAMNAIQRRRWWGGMADRIGNQLQYNCAGVHIRFEDSEGAVSFGVVVHSLTAAPRKTVAASLGAIPRLITWHNIAFYLDPIDPGKSPRHGMGMDPTPSHPFLLFDEGSMVLEFPNVFTTLLKRTSARPGGRGKRQRARVTFSGAVFMMHPRQMSDFIIFCSEAFGKGEYCAWKRNIRKRARTDCRPLGPSAKMAYLAAVRGNDHAIVESLEQRMSFSDMVVLRKEALRVNVSCMKEGDQVDQEFMSSLDVGLLRGGMEEAERFARVLQLHRHVAWEPYTAMREVLIEHFLIRGLEVRLLQADIGTLDYVSGSRLATFHAASLALNLRIFLARTASSARTLSVGATGEEGEPQLPWMHFGLALGCPSVADDSAAPGAAGACLLDCWDPDKGTIRADVNIWSDYRVALSTEVTATRLAVVPVAWAETAASTFRIFYGRSRRRRCRNTDCSQVEYPDPPTLDKQGSLREVLDDDDYVQASASPPQEGAPAPARPEVESANPQNEELRSKEAWGRSLLLLRGVQVEVRSRWHDAQVLVLQAPSLPASKCNVLCLELSGDLVVKGTREVESLSLRLLCVSMFPCVQTIPSRLLDSSLLHPTWLGYGMQAMREVSLLEVNPDMSIEYTGEVQSPGDRGANAGSSRPNGDMEFPRLSLILPPSATSLSRDRSNCASDFRPGLLVVKLICSSQGASYVAGGILGGPPAPIRASLDAQGCGQLLIPIEENSQEFGLPASVTLTLCILDARGAVANGSSEVCVEMSKERLWVSLSGLKVKAEWWPSILVIRAIDCRNLSLGEDKDHLLEPFLRMNVTGCGGDGEGEEVLAEFGQCTLLPLPPSARMPSGTSSVVSVTVMDRGAMEDELIGTAEVSVPSVPGGCWKVTDWASLRATEGGVAGEVRLEVGWMDGAQDQLEQLKQLNACEEEDDGEEEEPMTPRPKLLAEESRKEMFVHPSGDEEDPSRDHDGKEKWIVCRHLQLQSCSGSLRLADLDIAVLMAGTKWLHSSIVRAGRSGEVGAEEMQLRIKEELKATRLAKIEALRSAFSGDDDSSTNSHQLVDLREVVKLLRDLDAGRGLTETEIARDVDEFVRATVGGMELVGSESGPASACATVEEGFICPECRVHLPSQRALRLHFAIFHGEDTMGESDSMQSGELRDWATVPVEKFIQGLQLRMDELPHSGPVLAICEEFASQEIIERVAPIPLLDLLAGGSAQGSLKELWRVYESETGASRDSIGGQDVRTLQIRMVRALKNYEFARSVWGHLIVPELFHLPRAEGICAASERSYYPMPAPVEPGHSYYVDKPVYTIKSFPPSLQRRLLTGIKTHRKDRNCSGVRAFLTFTLTRPATVIVCYDCRLPRTPVWLLYFTRTSQVVSTTECEFSVWEKRYGAGIVRLGCNEGWRKGCANYFVLLAPELGADRPDPARANMAAKEGWSPHWLLTSKSFAGGKESLHRAIEALVERQKMNSRRRRLRETAKPFLDKLRGNSSSGTGLALFNYDMNIGIGPLSLKIVDPLSRQARHLSLAELTLEKLAVQAALRHFHPGDWLGRPDALKLSLTYAARGTFLNTNMGCVEHVLEPVAGEVVAENAPGSAITRIQVVAGDLLVINLSSALADSLRSAASLVAQNWNSSYLSRIDQATYTPDIESKGLNEGGSFLVENFTGVDIAVVGAVSWDRSVQASDGSPDTPHGVNGNKAGRGGFVCPDCHVELLGPDELLAHFEAFHDSGGLHSGPLVAIQRGQSRMCSLPYLSVSSAEPQVGLQVEGFLPLEGILVGASGSQLRKLIAARSPSKTKKKDTDAVGDEKVGQLALHVTVRPARRGEGGKSVHASMVMELRSNVCLSNASTSPLTVELFRGEPPVSLPSGSELSLPLPLLYTGQLKVKGEAASAWDSPLWLPQELLDPMLPDGLRRTPALESNSFTIDENRLPSINDGACLWTLIAHPPYVITNALPCAMEIIVTQLPRHRSRQQSLRLPAGNFRDPALDLFFLPEVEIESARNSTCLDSPGSRISSPLSGTVTAWQGIVALGKEARVGSIVEGYPIHVRVRFPAGELGGEWSDAAIISAREHRSRQSFNEESSACLPLTWAAAAGLGADDMMQEGVRPWPRIVLERRWGRTGGRRLTLFAEYWVINNTGLPLLYRAERPAAKPRTQDSALEEAEEDANALLLSDAEYASDGNSAHFFGTGTPALLACSGRKLQVMPYDTKSICVCDISAPWRVHTLRACEPGFLKTLHGVLPDSALHPDALLLSLASSEAEGGTLSFWATQHAVVYIHLPQGCQTFSWLTYEGFRVCNHSSVYRRFYRGHTLVRLKSPLVRCTLIVAPAEQLEADIRELEVKRDVGELVFCRDRYCLVPGFQAGDRPYLDREYTFTTQPPQELAGAVLIQTAQNDKRSSGWSFLRFAVMGRSTVYVCTDARVSRPPAWLTSRGWEHRPDLQLEGVEYRSPYTYNVYAQELPAGLVTLGGNSCNSPSPKRMYFVLVQPDRTIQDPSHDVAPGTLSSVHWWPESRGNIELPSPPLDDMRWSRRFNADAASNSGQLESPCATFGVTISKMSGLFHRTTVVTLFPRYVLMNNLKESICVDSRKGAPLNLAPGSSGVVYRFDGVPRSGLRGKEKGIMLEGAQHAIPADATGETHLWLTSSSSGRRILLTATTTIMKATVFVDLSDGAAFSPYRIENRTPSQTILYRQQGSASPWQTLPPQQWQSFVWEDPRASRLLSVSCQGRSALYSLDKIGPVESWDGSGRLFYASVRAEGRTRVLALSDTPPERTSLLAGAEMDALSQIRRLYTCLDISVFCAGLNINLVKSATGWSEGSEILSMHVDEVQVTKHGGSDQTEVSIFHVQVDDMRKHALMPIILRPVDSGFNSHLSLEAKGRSIPFIRVLYEREIASVGVPHFKSFEIALGEVALHLDLDYALELAGFVTQALPAYGNQALVEKWSRKAAKAGLRSVLPIPRYGDSSLVYLELFRHGSIVLHTELRAGPNALNLHKVLAEEPGRQAASVQLLGGSFLGVIQAVGGSIAHMRPTFVFSELIVTHYFGNALDFVMAVAAAIAQQGVAQSYKLVGSMDLLGDPLSLVDNLGDGVVQFIRKTHAEFIGDSHTRGEGARVLMRSLVGGTFGSASKIAGTLENLVRGLAGAQAIPRLYGTAGVQNFEHGLEAGREVLVETMRAGLAGLVERPMEGAAEEGVAGFVTGVAKGLVGVVAAPVAGALGAVSRVTEGVDAQTRWFDERCMQHRRPARLLLPSHPMDLVSRGMLECHIPQRPLGKEGTGKSAPSRVDPPLPSTLRLLQSSE